MTRLARDKFLATISTFLTLLILSLPAHANIADWGMVQQFNKQLELAKAGKIQSMYEVGNLYMRGRGVNRNMEEAANWFQKAANTGHASAQAKLGILYFEGRGVKQDYNKAIKLLNAAAKQEVPSAYYQLANMFELGTGVRQDLHQSIYWYKRAEQSGYYLAKAKIEKLEKRLANGVVDTPATQNVVKQNTSSPLLAALLRGRWLKRKTAVGYLPSSITNCAKESNNSISCISTSQERSTGAEIVTFNTESTITIKNNKQFDISYSNNVLDVSLQKVEDGNGQLITPTTTRIKKGKQGKVRQIQCQLKDNKTISCTKGGSSFILVSQ